MKKIWPFIVLTCVLLSCSDNNRTNSNPNIPNYSVNAYLNTSLPTYNNLLYVSSPVFVSTYGAKGIIVMKTGEGTYTAFDAACPNQALASCVAMTIDGIYAVCSCDKTSYNLFTGLGGQQYPMKQYRVELSGTSVHVYN
jgi:nitrite reductase/ring-hydroxylating ferredoxin subunit